MPSRTKLLPKVQFLNFSCDCCESDRVADEDESQSDERESGACEEGCEQRGTERTLGKVGSNAEGETSVGRRSTAARKGRVARC